MAATRMPLLVHTEDGKTTDVTADQRDMAAFEVAHKMGFPAAMDSMPFMAWRFVGWHAQRRVGQIDVGVTYDDWDKDVIEVEPADDEDPAVDPGSPAAADATSSA